MSEMFSKAVSLSRTPSDGLSCRLRRQCLDDVLKGGVSGQAYREPSSERTWLSSHNDSLGDIDLVELARRLDAIVWNDDERERFDAGNEDIGDGNDDSSESPVSLLRKGSEESRTTLLKSRTSS